MIRKSTDSPPERSFEDQVFDRAAETVEVSKNRRWNFGSAEHVERQIALVLDELRGLEILESRLARDLDRAEMAINTELLQMEQRTPTYSPYRYPEREKLQRRLQSLEQERRRITLHNRERATSLRERMLNLLNVHAQLEAIAGDR